MHLFRLCDHHMAVHEYSGDVLLYAGEDRCTWRGSAINVRGEGSRRVRPTDGDVWNEVAGEKRSRCERVKEIKAVVTRP